MKNTTKRLVELENEIKAQKTFFDLNFGMLERGSDIPKTSWSGHVGNAMNTTHSVSARWVITFTRSDSNNKPPLAQMCFDYSLGKTAAQDQRDSGFYKSYSVDDEHADDEYRFESSFLEIGQKYVKWKIDAGAGWYYSSSDGTNVRLYIEIISMVPGNVKIERVV